MEETGESQWTHNTEPCKHFGLDTIEGQINKWTEQFNNEVQDWDDVQSNLNGIHICSSA